MKRSWIRVVLPMLVLVLAPAILSQPSVCPAMVANLAELLDEVCSTTGRNQICYGNSMIQSTLQSEVNDIQFEQVGDIANVDAFHSLRLSPIQDVTEEWGVAMMFLQANLPNTLPGQNVAFILFGDIEMTSAADISSGASPMQAFYFSTGIGVSECHEVQESGLLVQTPKGAGQIQFAMNGMDISLGSTIFVQSNVAEGRMSVSMLDGAGVLRVGETVIPSLEGTRVNLPLGEDLLVGDDFEITAFDESLIDRLPLNALDPNHFELAAALDDEALSELVNNLEQGEVICGNGTHWDCEGLPWLLGGDSCPLDENGLSDCGDWDRKWGEDGYGSVRYEDLRSVDDVGLQNDTESQVENSSGNVTDMINQTEETTSQETKDSITTVVDTRNDVIETPTSNTNGGVENPSPTPTPTTIIKVTPEPTATAEPVNRTEEPGDTTGSSTEDSRHSTETDGSGSMTGN